MPQTKNKINEKNVAFFNKMTEFLSKEILTQEDFINAFEQVAKVVKKIREKNDQELAHIKEVLNNTAVDIRTSINDTLDERLKTLSRTLNDRLASVDKKVSKLRDGVDGKDADEDLIVERIVAQIPEKEQLVDGPDEIRNKLELLQDDERLTFKAISGLEEELDKLKKQRLGGRGGGHTDIGVAASMGRLVKTETPTGDIDGANTDFVTSSPINAILSYMLNGEVVGSVNYTVSGRTITWGTAPPSVYSGKDHEIIYV
jgi:hypothetical protein